MLLCTLFALGFGYKACFSISRLFSQKLKGKVSKPKVTAALAVIFNIPASPPHPFISLFILQFIPPLPLCRWAWGQSRDFEVALLREERESLWLISCPYPNSSSLHQLAGSEEETELASPPTTNCCMLQIPFTRCYLSVLEASDNLTCPDTKLQIRGVAPLSVMQGNVKCSRQSPSVCG